MSWQRGRYMREKHWSHHDWYDQTWRSTKEHQTKLRIPTSNLILVIPFSSVKLSFIQWAFNYSSKTWCSQGHNETMHDIKKSWDERRASEQQTLTNRTTRWFHRRSNWSRSWPARERGMPWNIVPRWSNTAFTEKRFPWFIQATRITKSSPFPLVLCPSIDFWSSYARAGRQGTTWIRGQFLLSDFLLEFCKHLTWNIRHRSSYSTHNESASVPLSSIRFRFVRRPLFTHAHVNGADQETAGSLRSGSELLLIETESSGWAGWGPGCSKPD